MQNVYQRRRVVTFVVCQFLVIPLYVIATCSFSGQRQMPLAFNQEAWIQILLVLQKMHHMEAFLALQRTANLVLGFSLNGATSRDQSEHSCQKRDDRT